MTGPGASSAGLMIGTVTAAGSSRTTCSVTLDGSATAVTAIITGDCQPSLQTSGSVGTRVLCTMVGRALYITDLISGPFVGDSGWITPSLTAITSAVGYNTVGYRGEGPKVFLRGLGVAGGTIGIGTSLFTLGTAYRPPSAQSALYGAGQSGGGAGLGINITTLGAVSNDVSLTAGQLVSFDGLWFYRDA